MEEPQGPAQVVDGFENEANLVKLVGECGARGYSSGLFKLLVHILLQTIRGCLHFIRTQHNLTVSSTVRRKVTDSEISSVPWPLPIESSRCVEHCRTFQLPISPWEISQNVLRWVIEGVRLIDPSKQLAQLVCSRRQRHHGRKMRKRAL